MRVTLRWIEIVNTGEPVWKDRGQFLFVARISADTVTEQRFPDSGSYEITDQPPWNRVVLNRCIYEGNAVDRLLVELKGEVSDLPAAADPLEDYRREFTGAPVEWIGSYEESMRNWRVCYTIEGD